ncbi:MAG TPA: hypothetical protein VHA07_13905 [Devosia sp.]|nr:hypothetical protein [Devosia sp.]
MRVLGVVTGFTVLAACPALATDVTFQGTLSGVCTLAVPTPGLLGLNASGELTSEPPAGLSAIVTVLSIGSNQLTIDPPVWAAATPVGYDATGEDLLVSYLGVGGLSIANQAFTDTQTSVNINSLPLTALTVNAKVTNPNGFAAGNYALKVVVTCAP